MNTFDSTNIASSLNNAFLMNMTASTTTPANPSAAPPSVSASQMNAFNNQIKFELEQHNIIKMQQYEAIRLIQLSLEKLSSTITVPLLIPQHSTTTSTQKSQGDEDEQGSSSESRQSSSGKTRPSKSSSSSILVYKETNLRKNLLVSKILNKAKFYYYQSIVQTMRLSLISKLNYYSTLINQLNVAQSEKLKNKDNKESSMTSLSYDETSIIEEMKILMQQIWQETYQFNLTNNPQGSGSPEQQQQQQMSDFNGVTQSFFNLPQATSSTSTSTSTTSTSDVSTKNTSEANENNEKSAPVNDKDNGDELTGKSEPSSSSKSKECEDKAAQTAQESSSSSESKQQQKRIEQLKDVKLSLYSLLFNNSSEDEVPPVDSSSGSSDSSVIKNCSNVLNETQNSLIINNNINNTKPKQQQQQQKAEKAVKRKRLASKSDSSDKRLKIEKNYKSALSQPSSDFCCSSPSPPPPPLPPLLASSSLEVDARKNKRISFDLNTNTNTNKTQNTNANVVESTSFGQQQQQLSVKKHRMKSADTKRKKPSNSSGFKVMNQLSKSYSRCRFKLSKVKMGRNLLNKLSLAHQPSKREKTTSFICTKLNSSSSSSSTSSSNHPTKKILNVKLLA